MEINYWIIGIIVILAVCLVGFLIWKNRKDEKSFEQDTIQSELKPEKHDEDKEAGI
ncbi:hypothetical protein [Mucilaginibacter paludis]|uniref:Uncharacterized protein n=1 Tax=Mucilaginibacter paludis DSM 18603 TaxID=714943 RepID=H1YHG0_9SPHI|nr:hypothetical protein [Mucilaginibacter paludis]EHQ25494.1 hypothetical protein Mucpa_1332 [Mucilaginibacter paludis DSM 18603]